MEWSSALATGIFSKAMVHRSPLFLADLLFLWMFMASKGFERMAAEGCIAALQGFEARALAGEFAARWRHGMVEGWPLYIPGFFATALALWHGSKARSWSTLLLEAGFVMALAGSMAALLSPFGTRHLLELFQDRTGFFCAGMPLRPAFKQWGPGLYTLIVWSVFVVSAERAFRSASLRPLGLPVALTAVLAWLRPVASLDNLLKLWGWRIWHGDAAAIFSLLAVVGVLAGLLRKGVGSRARLTGR